MHPVLLKLRDCYSAGALARIVAVSVREQRSTEVRLHLLSWLYFGVLLLLVESCLATD